MERGIVSGFPSFQTDRTVEPLSTPDLAQHFALTRLSETAPPLTQSHSAPLLTASHFPRRFRSIPQVLGSLTTALYLTFSPSIIHAQGNQIGDDAVKTELMTEVKQRGLLDIFGNRISEPVLVDGSWRIALEKAVLEKKPDNKIVLSPLAEYLHNIGLDDKLENGTFGVTVPPRRNYIPLYVSSDDPLQGYSKYFQFPDSVIERSKEIQDKIDIGLPTAFGKEYKDPQGNVVYTVYRYENISLQLWNDGQIELVLLGDAAFDAKILPIAAKLTASTDDPEIIVPQNATNPLAVSVPDGGYGWDWAIHYFASHTGISDAKSRQIVGCESTFDRFAHNRSGASGPWQIMPSHAWRFTAHGWNYYTDVYDIYRSTIIASELANDAGVYGTWSCADEFKILL